MEQPFDANSGDPMISLGKKTVTTAGTAVQVTTSDQPNLKGKVRVQAFPGNTGFVYIGLKGVVGSTGAQVLGIVGIPAATGPLPYIDFEIPLAQAGVAANALWLDVSVNGDSVIVSVF